MLKFTEATAIALHAMIYITNRGNQIISLKEIAERFEISENHLSKILQRLVKTGLLTSVKGPKGGFSIVPKYKNMSFMKVYETIEGKLEKHKCLFHFSQKNCPKCIMGNLVEKINGEFINYMENHKISDFVI